VGENASIVLQGTSSSNYGDAILEAHMDCGCLIDDSLENGNSNFLGVERFLQIGYKDAEILGEWVDMNQFFDIQEDKENCGNFEDLPSILKFHVQMKNLHQPITATTMALAILAIDGIEDFQICFLFLFFLFLFCFIIFLRILLPFLCSVQVWGEDFVNYCFLLLFCVFLLFLIFFFSFFFLKVLRSKEHGQHFA